MKVSGETCPVTFLRVIGSSLTIVSGSTGASKVSGVRVGTGRNDAVVPVEDTRRYGQEGERREGQGQCVPLGQFGKHACVCTRIRAACWLNAQV